MRCCNNFLLPLLMLLSSCASSGPEDQSSTQKLSLQAMPDEVEVITLQREEFPLQLLSNGKLSAVRRARLYFEEPGVIHSVNFANGDRVQAGEVIAELDESGHQTALRTAEIAMDRARLEYLDVLAGLGYGVSDTASAPAEVRSLAAIRSGYSAAKLEYDKALTALQACSLKAPFSGRIADLSARQWEKSGADPFCTIVDDSAFEVSFSALESEYPFLSKGQEVIVTAFADENIRSTGRITSVNPTVDGNGQIKVTAQLKRENGMLDGMNVRIVVQRFLKDKLVVPKNAVVIRDNLQVLFRYIEGKSEWVYVNVLNANSESYVVEGNSSRGSILNEGDSVIVSGNLNLAEGSTVTLKK